MTFEERHDLMVKWRHVIGVHPIPTWTEPATLAYCAELASRCDTMIECGSYLGVSAKVMLEANPNLHIWCVDHFRAFAWNKEVCSYFLRDEIASGRCEIIEGDSERAMQMLGRHMTGRIDGIWIDDGHAVEDLQRDIRCLMPLLSERGVMWGHDFEVPHNDVAQGVLSMIPKSQLKFPVPRVWEWRHP
jgi:predicted O-methyltransferase YrrM